MAFGSADPIDERNRRRIRELEGALAQARAALEKGCAITIRERDYVLAHARAVNLPPGAYC